jgi:putative membrane protein
MKSMILIAAVALAVPASAQVMTPADYVAAAGAGDLFEQTSSRLVLESTSDPKIRDFATMMIAHHTKSTADVKAAAARARVKAPPPKLNPLQTELIAELRAETGVARDQRYVAEQKAAHNQALAVHQAYAADGTAAPLKAAASAIVPVVTSHIEMLKTM